MPLRKPPQPHAEDLIVQWTAREIKNLKGKEGVGFRAYGSFHLTLEHDKLLS
jgi:hypothetical protein